MNRDAIMGILRRALSEIDIHPALIEELIRLIVGSGVEAKFFTLFQTRLKILLQCGVTAIQQKEFEALGDHLFSMHLSGRGFNIRILFSFLPNQAPTLLLCFFERGGKGKTDYSSYLEPAKIRRVERLEVYAHGAKRKL